MERKNWHEYFSDIAELVSHRATCDRKRVGAIIVKDKRILATGYNGSIPGSEHCDDVGHLMENNHCVRTIHAEVNAIAQCAKYGISCQGATLYCNTSPCWNCFKTIVSAGIREIYYGDNYTSELKKNVKKYAKKLGVKLEKL